VGHELRTPVTTLRGLAELLAADPDAPNAAELRESLVRTARRTEGLLDDLLLAAGVSTALPVEAPTETAVAGVRVLARPGTPDRVLAALVDNADRYADGTGQVRAWTEGDEAVLVVADRGPGVPEEELPLVTEPFFRGEAAVLTHHSLGIGLAVARALVEQDGGRLAVRNRDGGGLEVEVRLPRAPT
jgi:signal transduction histidine kinase